MLDVEIRSDDITTVEPMLAWRAWTLVASRRGTDVLLRPIAGSARPWPPRAPARASCRRLRRHHAPELDCTCGLHGVHAPDVLRHARDPAVIGSVALWGRVIEHELGYRAEFAYPQRLRLICPFCFWQRGLQGSACSVVARLPRRRLMPLCEQHAETCRRYGLPIGDLLPAESIQHSLLSTYAVDLLPA